METILLFLPTFFTFFTGILISWGIYLIMSLIYMPNKKLDYSKKLIKNICLFAICSFTFFLVCALFIFTTFTAFHMPTILFLEIWYATLLYRITATPWDTPCHELVNWLKARKNPILLR